MIQKFSSIGLSVLLLTACSSTVSQTYRLEFDSENTDRQADLTIASMNVIDRRLEAHGADALDMDVEKEEGGTFIEVELYDAALAETLTSELTAPFVLDLMVQSEEGEPVDAAVEQHGNFRKIDLGGEDVDWLFPQADPAAPEQGRLLIGFTPEGVEKMQAAFRDNPGEFMGLFVRQQLAAKILIEGNVPDNAIVISGLPNQELAEIFADDVNVGLHVTFVPVE